VIAVLGGLAAAISWAIATLCTSRASRLVPVTTVLGAVMLVGLVVTLPAVAVSGVPDGLDGSTIAWLAISGIGNVAGLGFVYSGLRVGKIAIVGALASTEGAVAATLAVTSGERLGGATSAALLAIVVGIVLAATGGAAADGMRASNANMRRAVLCGSTAALLFGLSLYAAGRAAADVPAAWVALPARLTGTLAVALPLAIAGRFRILRSALPFVVAAGVAEVTGAVRSRSALDTASR
jgi:uncharacterized membrane protein